MFEQDALELEGVREGLGRKQLQELGAWIEEPRAKAPMKLSSPNDLKKVVDAVIV